MRDTYANRSAVFRQAYWARVVELFDLLDNAGREQTVHAARSAKLGRKTLKRLVQASRDIPPGPLAIETADKISKRYALWETRRVFDRGSYEPHVEHDTRRIDEALWSGIYELDVALRRQIEALLRLPPSERDREAPTVLRSTLEASAGRLAAALDLAASAEQYHPNWADVSDDYDTVCNELDDLLVLVGAPPPRP